MMPTTKMEARVLYEEVRAEQDGLYIWVDPAEGSILRIQQLIKRCPFKATNATEWHTTVLYHKGELPEAIDVPRDRWFEGRMREVVTWQDHKDRTIVVLLLDVPELDDLHRQLLAQGLRHSYPEYNAHLTLCYETQSSPELRLWLDGVNAKLRQVPYRIVLGPQIKASSLA